MNLTAYLYKPKKAILILPQFISITWLDGLLYKPVEGLYLILHTHEVGKCEAAQSLSLMRPGNACMKL
jgi:hypothetical protein